MNLKEELKEEILSIWKIFYQAKTCFIYSKYLHGPDSKDELDYVNSNHFFNFSRHIMFRNAVIELCKLYNEENANQKFNIPKFINKLKPLGYFNKLKFDDKIIKEWEIKIQSHKQSIKDINILRDKLYAHTDRQNIVHDALSIGFNVLEELISLTEDIIVKVHLHLDIHAEMEIRENLDIVKNLVAYQQERIAKMLKNSRM